jgi:hypothetical protein
MVLDFKGKPSLVPTSNKRGNFLFVFDDMSLTVKASPPKFIEKIISDMGQVPFYDLYDKYKRT